MDFCSDSKLYDAEKFNYKVNMITSNFIMMMFIHNLRCFLQNILFPFLSALKIRFKWFIMHHTRDQIDFKTIFFFSAGYALFSAATSFMLFDPILDACSRCLS